MCRRVRRLLLYITYLALYLSLSTFYILHSTFYILHSTFKLHKMRIYMTGRATTLCPRRPAVHRTGSGWLDSSSWSGILGM
jgi:hypothetical protein